MLEQKVENILQQVFIDYPELFLIELNVDSQQRIKITIDGDQGVRVADCVAISRAVEQQLDREAYDFSLEVSSAGAFSPLVQIRQYPKNIGRTLELTTLDDKNIEGVLEKVEPDAIVISWKERVAKEKGKGKTTVQKTETIPFDHIKKSNVKIIF
jgi:ribosome maturation factor RimP